jgi:hypothetical protein
MLSSRVLLLATALNATLVVAAWTHPRTQEPVQAPSVLRAQLIELVDGQGNVRAQLHLGDDGSGQLRLRDAKGNVAVKLGSLREGGAALLLMDPTVEPGITAKNPGPSITLRQGNRTKVLTP